MEQTFFSRKIQMVRKEKKLAVILGLKEDYVGLGSHFYGITRHQRN